MEDKRFATARGKVEAPFFAPESIHTQAWRKSFALVEELAALDDEALQARLALVRADDAELAASVVRMLARATDNRAATEPLLHSTIHFPPTYVAGDEVGAYTLERHFGVGGMANIWRARRTDGTLNRPVAIKIPHSYLSAQVLGERFARERNVLAQLNHPNITNIFDAGTDARGQPFLALEFIYGTALDEYCAAHVLDIPARVRLIIDAANALHHAHSHLVLHRDIKPSNMLVTDKGALKLLDFGIAKLLSNEHTAQETEFTRMTGNALTPRYAAPEQLLGDTVTTSTDVYALAVVLFELLTGESPFPSDAQTVVGRIRCINDQARKLDTVAVSETHAITCGENTPARHARALRGDLCAIVSKALRKAPNERYGSALAFAEDLQNYLSHHPVKARQGALLYQARRFIQRQKNPIAIAAVGALVATGLGVRTWQANDIAKDSTSRAASIDGLLQGLFSGMSPDEAKSRTFTAKDLLDKTTEIIDKSAAEGKYEIPSMRIGEIYRDIGAYDEAIVRFKKERAAAEKRGDKRGAFLAHLHEIDALTTNDELDTAERELRNFERSAKTVLTRPDPLLARMENLQGHALAIRKNPIESQRLYELAENQWRVIKPFDASQLVWSLEGQAIAARNRAMLPLARQKLDEVVEIDKRYPVRPVVERLQSLATLGDILMHDARFAESRAVLFPLCEELFTRFGGTNADTRRTCRNLVQTLTRLGEFTDAEQMLDRLMATTGSADLKERININHLRAVIDMYRGETTKAESGIAAVVALRERESGGRPNDWLLRARRQLGEVWLRQGRHFDAARLLGQIEKDQEALLGPAQADTAYTTVMRVLASGESIDRKTRFEMLSRAAETLRTTRGDHHPVVLSVSAYIALCSSEVGAARKAELAARVRKELGWQVGANDLANQLETLSPTCKLQKMPIVF